MSDDLFGQIGEGTPNDDIHSPFNACCYREQCRALDNRLRGNQGKVMVDREDLYAVLKISQRRDSEGCNYCAYCDCGHRFGDPTAHDADCPAGKFSDLLHTTEGKG